MSDYKSCPIFDCYRHHDGKLAPIGSPEVFFIEPITDYLIGRLEYILSQFIQAHPEVVSDGLVTFEVWEKVVNFTLTTIAPNIKNDSFRRYKRALNLVINSALKAELAPAVFLRNLLGSIATFTTETLTSPKAKKADRIRVDELYFMRAAALEELDRFALDWLEFNLLTNLRPNEIQFAEIFYTADGPFLSTKNTVKSDATRVAIEKGEVSAYRILPLKQLSLHDFLLIERFLVVMHLLIEERGYSFVYETLRGKLKRLSNRCFDRSISLSVGRTQYAANAKALSVSPDELAALMGHTDPTRPMRSYGRKAFGYAKLSIRDHEHAFVDDDE